MRRLRPVLARAGGELAQRTYFGLYALQHRGQESAGIAVSDGERTTAVRDMGLVSQVFDEARLAALEAGHIALGHVRYSTTGSASWENAQPEFHGRGELNVAVAHNGNLVNAVSLGRELAEEGFEFNSTSDTTFIAAAAVKELEQGRSVGEAVQTAMRRFEGAYSVAMIFRDKLVAFRDPHGFRPLCIGEVEGRLRRLERDLRPRYHRRPVPARGRSRRGRGHRRFGAAQLP